MKKILFLLIFLFSSATHAFMPQSGTWVVSSELDGRPGRGIALDVQNNIFVLQIYAYESSGQPTFYMASGTLSNNAGTGDLQRFKGGRYLGSAPMSGTLDKVLGKVRLRFTSGLSGFIQLPGEGEVAISRFNFGYAAVPASLMGFWSFSSLGTLGLNADLAVLSVQGRATDNGSGVMMNSDGSFACEHQVRGAFAGMVFCVRINYSKKLQAVYRFVYSVNEGEGYSNILDSVDQLMWIRRLTTPGDVGTGIIERQESHVSPDNEAVLAAYIQQISQ